MTGITNAETVRIHRLLWVGQQANYAKIATATRKRFRCAKNEIFVGADWAKHTNPIVHFGLTKGSTETLWEWTNLHISVVIAPHRGTGRAVIWEKTEGPCNCRIEVYGDLLPLAMRQVGGIDLLSTD
jgi:hypothetical protein